MDLNPYLTFNGNLEEAFAHYAKVLGGEVTVLQRFAEMPGADRMPPEMLDKVMHGELRVGDRKIMGSDNAGPDFVPPASVHIQTGWTDFDEAARVFADLSEGGEVIMPFAETFWSPGFGICRDCFGVPWMVNVYGDAYMGDPATS